MSIKIALVGNPNCGKTTLFNALTGSRQFVGNWPGVTVEKKEGELKKHNDVIITDLPGIYSLSPYTLEEVVARNYLIEERPNVILNIVDGSNLERNLYLTTQLMELGIPVVVAINMMDLVKKNGDVINTNELAIQLGCKVVEISALKEEGIMQAAEAAIESSNNTKIIPMHSFSGVVEHAIAHIEEAVLHEMSEEQQRWYAIKIFERDSKVTEKLNIRAEILEHIEKDIEAAEKELDDDAESIITNERYIYIASIVKASYKKKNSKKLTNSDKIDKIITNRLLGIPIFAVIMFLVYWISMVGIGSAATDWANDGLFGDGWHLFGIGSADYEEITEEYTNASLIVEGYNAYIEEKGVAPKTDFKYDIVDAETLAVSEETASLEDYKVALATLENIGEEPDPANYGVWIPGIPVLIENLLDAMNVAKEGVGAVVRGVILDGIVAGVGAVLGFIPQMLVLFFLLAFLEACGYMARIAFVLDRVFRKFGLSGKSFIPMLIGSGCGVPGIMASRTIENECDRRMTVITTTFIPCSAKIPFIAMIAGAIFGGSSLVATSAYFVGILAIITSGIMLKKTRIFIGEPAPFVMELPAYHMPTLKNLFRSMWERAWSFIKKAGTIILISTVLVWFTSYFGFTDEGFCMLSDEELDLSILAWIGKAFAWIFKPLGFGTWQATVASITGLVAKENIVGTIGILYGATGDVYATLALNFTAVTGYAYLIFNLLCAPCFAAMGAIKREMNSRKWTCFALLYQCGFAYCIALMINQFVNVFTGKIDIIGLVFAIAIFIGMLYMLFKSSKKTSALT